MHIANLLTSRVTPNQVIFELKCIWLLYLSKVTALLEYLDLKHQSMWVYRKYAGSDMKQLIKFHWHKPVQK